MEKFINQAAGVNCLVRPQSSPFANSRRIGRMEIGSLAAWNSDGAIERLEKWWSSLRVGGRPTPTPIGRKRKKREGWGNWIWQLEEISWAGGKTVCRRKPESALSFAMQIRRRRRSSFLYIQKTLSPSKLYYTRPHALRRVQIRLANTETFRQLVRRFIGRCWFWSFEIQIWVGQTSQWRLIKPLSFKNKFLFKWRPIGAAIHAIQTI